MAKTINIVCEDSVDISGVSALHNQISSEIQQGCTISLDASQIERIDTAGLQLFAALFIDAATQNITINWLNPSDTLQTSARLLGLEELLQLA